jgi:hypothetical protein
MSSKPKNHDKKYGTHCTFLHQLTMLKLESLPELHSLSEEKIYELYCQTYENFKTAVKAKADSCKQETEKID